MRLGGWTRLGIVLSVLWLAGVSAYATVEYSRMAAERRRLASLPPPPTGFVIDAKTDALFFTWSASDARAKGLSAPILKTRFALFLSVLLLPITVAWSAFGIGAWSIRWVSAGFKGRHSNVG